MVVAGTRYYLGTDFNRAQLADWTGSKEKDSREQKSQTQHFVLKLCCLMFVSHTKWSRGDFLGRPALTTPPNQRCGGWEAAQLLWKTTETRRVESNGVPQLKLRHGKPPTGFSGGAEDCL